jgi:hypothetical protein
MNPSLQTLGSIMLPILLETTSNEWIKLILHTFVLPIEMAIPMFISWDSLVDLKPQLAVTDDKRMFVHFETDEGAINIKGL